MDSSFEHRVDHGCEYYGQELLPRAEWEKEYQTRSRAGALEFFPTFQKAWNHQLRAGERAHEFDNNEMYEGMREPWRIWKISYGTYDGDDHRWVRWTFAGLLEPEDPEYHKSFIINHPQFAELGSEHIVKQLRQNRIDAVIGCGAEPDIPRKMKKIEMLQNALKSSIANKHDSSEQKRKRRFTRKKQRYHLNKLLKFSFWIDNSLEFEYYNTHGFYQIHNVLTETVINARIRDGKTDEIITSLINTSRRLEEMHSILVTTNIIEA